MYSILSRLSSIITLVVWPRGNGIDELPCASACHLLFP
uniref:Uncharacterized protein n=1 Tax=Ciona intestinalis TaxID=7719 RepID=H2XKX5_CIOIN